MFEYGFDNPIINLYLILGTWIWFLFGVYLFYKMSYKIYQSEYKKDETFEHIPIAMRWKSLLLISGGLVLIGPPLFVMLISFVVVILYLLSPFTEGNWIPWGLLLVVMSGYLWFCRKRFVQFMYQFIEKERTFEQYFMSHAKPWGVINEHKNQIESNKLDQVLTNYLLGGLIHFGLVPITIIVLLNLLF